MRSRTFHRQYYPHVLRRRAFHRLSSKELSACIPVMKTSLKTLISQGLTLCLHAYTASSFISVSEIETGAAEIGL